MATAYPLPDSQLVPNTFGVRMHRFGSGSDRGTRSQASSGRMFETEARASYRYTPKMSR